MAGNNRALEYYKHTTFINFWKIYFYIRIVFYTRTPWEIVCILMWNPTPENPASWKMTYYDQTKQRLKDGIHQIREPHLPFTCNSSSGKHSRAAHYWGNAKYLGIEKISIIKVNQGTGNRWTSKTGKADDCKDHAYPDAHLLGVFGQASYAADKETLHSIRKEAVYDDPGKKAIVRSDVLPQVEQHAGTKRDGREDV